MAKNEIPKISDFPSLGSCDGFAKVKVVVGGYYSLRRVLLTSQCFAKLIIFAPAVTAQIILPFRGDSFSKKIKMVK